MKFYVFLCVSLVYFTTYGLAETQLENLVSYTRCRVDADCLKFNNYSFCFNNDADVIGNCKCREGYELVSRNTTFFACLGPADYDQACEKNVQCQLTLSENAECYNSFCKCKEDAHLYTDGKCYVSVLLDDFCRSDGNCWINGDNFGNCVFGRCTCKYDYEIPTEDKRSCVTGKKLKQLCNNDAECSLTPNSRCIVNCVCSAGYALSRDESRCLKVATQFDDQCVENEQCSYFLQGSKCLSNNCTCDSEFHTWRNECVRSAKIGENCDDIKECIPDPKYSDIIDCKDKKCTCLQASEMFGCNSNANSIKVAIFVMLSFVLCIAF